MKYNQLIILNVLAKWTFKMLYIITEKQQNICDKIQNISIKAWKHLKIHTWYISQAIYTLYLLNEIKTNTYRPLDNIYGLIKKIKLVCSMARRVDSPSSKCSKLIKFNSSYHFSQHAAGHRNISLHSISLKHTELDQVSVE